MEKAKPLDIEKLCAGGYPKDKILAPSTGCVYRTNHPYFLGETICVYVASRRNEGMGVRSRYLASGKLPAGATSAYVAGKENAAGRTVREALAVYRKQWETKHNLVGPLVPAILRIVGKNGHLKLLVRNAIRVYDGNVVENQLSTRWAYIRRGKAETGNGMDVSHLVRQPDPTEGEQLILFPTAEERDAAITAIRAAKQKVVLAFHSELFGVPTLLRLKEKIGLSPLPEDGSVLPYEGPPALVLGTEVFESVVNLVGIEKGTMSSGQPSFQNIPKFEIIGSATGRFQSRRPNMKAGPRRSDDPDPDVDPNSGELLVLDGGTS